MPDEVMDGVPAPPERYCVVTMVTAEKAYCLAELLAALAALEVPAGGEVIHLIVDSKDLTEQDRQALEPFCNGEHPGEIWTYTPSDHIPTQYRCSWIAAEMRQIVHLALCGAGEANPFVGCDWVLWIDADVLPEPDTLVKLRAHNHPLVSGLVLNRGDGSPICGMTREQPREGYLPARDVTVRPGVQPVGWTGLGCFLARADVAKGISFWDYTNQIDPAYPLYIGEDAFFCFRAAAECGEPVLLDADVTPWHVDGSGVATRARWLGDQLAHDVRIIPTPLQQRPCLVPRVSGYSPRFGHLRAGTPHTTDAAGRELDSDEIRAVASSSRVFDLVEPPPAG